MFSRWNGNRNSPFFWSPLVVISVLRWTNIRTLFRFKLIISERRISSWNVHYIRGAQHKWGLHWQSIFNWKSRKEANIQAWKQYRYLELCKGCECCVGWVPLDILYCSRMRVSFKTVRYISYNFLLQCKTMDLKIHILSITLKFFPLFEVKTKLKIRLYTI